MSDQLSEETEKELERLCRERGLCWAGGPPFVPIDTGLAFGREVYRLGLRDQREKDARIADHFGNGEIPRAVAAAIRAAAGDCDER